MNAWLLVLVALAAWTALSLIAGSLVRRVLRWSRSSPARVPPAGAVPPAPVRAEDMGVGFVGASFDEEWSQADWAWPR